jgi:hypothetical protein
MTLMWRSLALPSKNWFLSAKIGVISLPFSGAESLRQG